MEKLTFDELYALLEDMPEQVFLDMVASDESRQAWLSQYGWTINEYEAAVVEMFDFDGPEE